MNGKNLLGMLTLVVGVCGVTTVDAQTSDNVQAETTIAELGVIDGSKTPDQIDYATKVRLTLGLYDAVGRQSLASSLSVGDGAVIEGMVGAQDLHLAAAQEQFDNNYLELCSRMDTMDVESLATEYLQLVAAKRSAEAARYRAAFARLSNAGKAVIDKYITETVTPNINSSPPSRIEDAQNDPEGYRFSMSINCYLKEHGELPPGSIDRQNEDQAQLQEGQPGTAESSTDVLSLEN